MESIGLAFYDQETASFLWTQPWVHEDSTTTEETLLLLSQTRALYAQKDGLADFSNNTRSLLRELTDADWYADGISGEQEAQRLHAIFDAYFLSTLFDPDLDLFPSLLNGVRQAAFSELTSTTEARIPLLVGSDNPGLTFPIIKVILDHFDEIEAFVGPFSHRNLSMSSSLMPLSNASSSADTR